MNCTRFGRLFDQAVGAIVVACLVAMVGLVFTNVVLRYVFNSGISVSDELARLLFVWLTFWGAILALRRNQHVSVSMILERVGPRTRRVLRIIIEVTIIACSALLVKGSWTFSGVNLNNYAPLTGLPMTVVFGLGVVAGVVFIVISGGRLWRLLSCPSEDDQPSSAGSETVLAD